MKYVLLTSLLLSSSLAQGVEHKISQKDKKFDQIEIKIKAGDSIVFLNDEKDITHNVYSLSSKNAFELKTQAPGSSSSVQFKEVGETEVECAIHTNMKLLVKVSK